MGGNGVAKLLEGVLRKAWKELGYALNYRLIISGD